MTDWHLLLTDLQVCSCWHSNACAQFVLPSVLLQPLPMDVPLLVPVAAAAPWLWRRISHTSSVSWCSLCSYHYCCCCCCCRCRLCLHCSHNVSSGPNICDKFRDIPLQAADFPGVDFSLMRHTTDKMWEALGARMAHDGGCYSVGEEETATEQRALEFYRWLMTRSARR
jgi:hypothetical protein